MSSLNIAPILSKSGLSLYGFSEKIQAETGENIDLIYKRLSIWSATGKPPDFEIASRYLEILGYQFEISEIQPAQPFKMDECLGIVKIEEDLSYTLMLQEYAGYFYLRVEDDGGGGILKIRLSRQGEVLTDYLQQVSTDHDFAWVRWAQNLIKQKG